MRFFGYLLLLGGGALLLGELTKKLHFLPPEAAIGMILVGVLLARRD